MAGATPELNLATAVDSDDNADYLTINLATSLRTLDALFNNLGGHTHNGAHQGGPLTITAGNIPIGTITSAQILDKTILAGDIADGTISTLNLADGAVTSVKLASSISITTLGVTGDLTVTGNISSLGGTLQLGQTAGNQGQLVMVHPNGRISRVRAGAAAIEFTNAANSAVIGSLDNVGNAVVSGNLTLGTAVNTQIAFGDCQMLATGATYIQTNGYLALGIAGNGYRLVLPNIANGNGQGYANSWVTYSCIDHAREAGLNVTSVDDPMGKVMALPGYYYDHLSTDSEGAVLQPMDSSPMYGFAASEVATVIPENAAYAEDGTPTGVDLPRMVVILWEAVRALNERVVALEGTPA